MRQHLFIAAALALGLMQVAAATPVGATETETPSITVIGQGEAQAVPDMATITLGVTHEAKEAGAAMAMTSDAVSRILESLTGLGIDARDLQTQRLSLNPVWSNRQASSGAAPRITGFVASNTVLVRVRDLDRLGAVMDTVISDGANNFNGLQFSVQDVEPLAAQARADAVENAIAKARQLAEAAGVTLGPVLSIAEQGHGRPAPMMMEMTARASDVPVAGGEISVRAAVTMVFSIGDGQ